MHKEVQKRFFDLITSKEPLYASLNNPIQTYKEMIHYRFKEVLLSAYPRFAAYLTEDELNILITEFIQTHPKTPYIWQMPDEFRTFIATTTVPLSYPFIPDLLWFEWIEIELFMYPFQRRAAIRFSWDMPVFLSPSALTYYLDYPSFKDDGIDIKGAYAVLIYYNFDKDEVHYQEITPFMCQFLQLLEGHLPNAALEIIALEYEIDAQEVKELLDEPLHSFAAMHVLTKK